MFVVVSVVVAVALFEGEEVVDLAVDLVRCAVT